MEKSRVSPRVILQAVLIVVVAPFLPLLISRHWDWWEAWVYGTVSVLGFVLSRVLAARRHPDILAERAAMGEHQDVQPWDRVFTRGIFLLGVLVPVVAGLEALLGGPPEGPPWLTILALMALVGGYVLSSWALIENRFFSAVVRIQTDRGQRVISSGPYRWVRHPGYAGGLLAYLATPLLLGTLWAYVPVAAAVALTLLRTNREDAMLQAELPGYRDYASRVRYRLLPGVW